jgi:H/ACA ribonucleoprotein complex non-core subunit NAF1
MDDFKVPQTIPQDLLLIQEFIDVPLPSNPVSETVVQDDISSSGSDDDDVDSSEEEIAADLTKGAADGDEDTRTVVNTCVLLFLPRRFVDSVQSVEPSDSSSDLSSDSDSDSEPSQLNEEGGKESNERQILQDFDEDEDPLPVPSSGNYFTTKNEVTKAEITAPEIDQVRPDEQLEKVGEIMTIVDRIVIVRGLPSQHFNHASERALDSDTLLVFDDRKVLGYVRFHSSVFIEAIFVHTLPGQIYETFGPTMQPLYQVKFCESFPLNPERVRVGREVFHVPSRSRFVFVSQIKSLKGSDASNVHDEEPGDDEVEFFSDDEAETAYRNRLKRR